MKAMEPSLAAPPRLASEGGAVGTLVRTACDYRPPFDQASAFERLRERASAGGPAFFRPRGLSLALVLCGVALGSLALFAYAKTHGPSFAPVAERARTLVPAVGERALPAGESKLDDGTQVRVDAGAAARVETGAAVTRIALERGTVTFDVSRQPAGRSFEVAARGYRFVVRGTSFSVSASESRIVLDVRAGKVAVFRASVLVTELGAGEHWTEATADLPERSVVPGQPAPENVVATPRVAPSSRSPGNDAAGRKAGESGEHQDCLALARARRARDAERCFVSQAAGSGLGAELALFELSRLRGDVLNDPAGALEALREHRARFPKGSLRAEADISYLHLLSRLGRHAELLSESAKVLETAKGRERGAELRMLRGHALRAGTKDFRRAEVEYAEVERAGGKFSAEAGYYRGVCLEALGNGRAASSAYRRYLGAPGRAHEAEARRRLSALEP
jgi:hypothetical protein